MHGERCLDLIETDPDIGPELVRVIRATAERLGVSFDTVVLACVAHIATDQVRSMVFARWATERQAVIRAAFEHSKTV